jgi:hypothetical protein
MFYFRGTFGILIVDEDVIAPSHSSVQARLSL